MFKTYNIYIVLLIYMCFCLSCEDNKLNYTEKQADSSFIMAQKMDNYIKDKAILGNCFVSKKIDEKIIFNIILIDRGYSYCFIKEYGKTNVKRHYYVFDDYIYYYFTPNYILDTSGITDYDILIENRGNYNNETFEYLLSDNFWNIPELRKLYYNDRTQPDDIKKLENLINNLKLFDNYEISSSYHNNILKELFILTQVNFLMYSGYGNYYYDNMQSVDDIFTYKNVIQVKDTSDIKKRQWTPYKIMNKWQKDNINFIMTKLEIIEKEIKEPNIFYFITDDNKLFRLEVNIINGKIKLKKEYINKHFMQLDPVWFFKKSRNKIVF